jgi:hypothetical protein
VWGAQSQAITRLHTARALIKLQRWTEACQALDQVMANWESSPYFDPCSGAEVAYLRAEIFAGTGDTSRVQECLKQIFDAQHQCEKNDYFQQSLSSARNMKR